MEAYPDVANNYVQVITQWPGRAAEEVEQQVSIPIEAQMNGLAAIDGAALGFAVRPVQRDDGVRRWVEQRSEPAKGSGKALAVESAEWAATHALGPITARWDKSISSRWRARILPMT